MKVIVQQSVLSKLLAQGALAALTDDAQGDSTSLSPLIQSVKITVDDNFTVESAVKTILTKCSIPATEENGIEVKEAGEVVVSAKDIVTWVSNQKEAKIGLALSKLDVPESLESKSEDMEDVKKTDVVKKIGTLKITSKDNSKTGSKWQLDAYDPTQLPKARVGTKLDKLFEIDSKTLKEVVDVVAVTAQKVDFQHVLDSMALQSLNGEVYACTTDTKRCSLYNMVPLIQNVGQFFSENGAKLLIPIKTLSAAIKAANEGKLTFEYDGERNSVLVSQDRFSARIAIPEKGVYGKFPDLSALKIKSYDNLCSMPKSILMSRLITCSIVNSDTALCQFANGELKIYVASDGGKSPSTATCSVEALDKEVKMVVGVQHLLDLCKLLKDEKVSVMVPSDGKYKTYKVSSKENPNFTFFAMVPDNPKYSSVTLE